MQKAQSKGHIWRGRRTGLLIDDRKVTKNESGRDNIDSFWDNAYLGDLRTEDRKEKGDQMK